MKDIQKIEQMVCRILKKEPVEFVLAGVVLRPEDVANPSGFLPVLFEHMQEHAQMFGLPKEFQPEAFGKVVDDKDALLEKTLQVSSKTGVVPLTCYLTDAAKMIMKLSVDQQLNLDQIIDPNQDSPFYLSAVLDELCSAVTATEGLAAEPVEQRHVP